MQCCKKYERPPVRKYGHVLAIIGSTNDYQESVLNNEWLCRQGKQAR